MPEKCECGSRFTVDHALSCKKGGFISLRHNILRNITSSLLAEVCKDVCIEPLQSNHSNHRRRLQSSCKHEQRSQIRHQCERFLGNGPSSIFHFHFHFLNPKHQAGTFTPLVFARTGGMRRECKKFYSRLAEGVAKKRRI